MFDRTRDEVIFLGNILFIKKRFEFTKPSEPKMVYIAI